MKGIKYDKMSFSGLMENESGVFVLFIFSVKTAYVDFSFHSFFGVFSYGNAVI